MDMLEPDELGAEQPASRNASNKPAVVRILMENLRGVACRKYDPRRVR